MSNEPPDLGPQISGGRGNGPSRNHERRIQILEQSSRAQTQALQDLEEKLFGDPDRLDEGGRGAFARIEGLIKADADRRELGSGRLWQFGTYLAVGLIVALATFLLTHLPTK